MSTSYVQVMHKIRVQWVEYQNLAQNDHMQKKKRPVRSSETISLNHNAAVLTLVYVLVALTVVAIIIGANELLLMF